MVCTRGKGDDILVEELEYFHDEIYYVIDKVKELFKNGENKENIAILFRTNRMGQMIERDFRKNKIPCHMSKSIDFFKREEIKDLLSFLKLKVNYKSVDDFENILLMIEGLGKAKAERFKRISKEKGIDVIDSLNYSNGLKLDPAVKEGIARIKESVVNYDKHPIDLFLNHFGYRNRLIKKYREDVKRLEDKFENIEVLRELFKGHGYSREGIKEFLHSLMELDKKEKTNDKVILSTIHKAKGLEWKHVFLVQCNEKILPFYNSKKLSNIKRDEELRLFYVAISRAKDFLTITHSKIGNYDKEQKPSQFLEII